eukprot:4663432-Karenia_brevis.AAC.1
MMLMLMMMLVMMMLMMMMMMVMVYPRIPTSAPTRGDFARRLFAERWKDTARGYKYRCESYQWGL